LKLTLHLPASDVKATLECFALPECLMLSDSKRALFVFRKGIERLRDEKRVAPDPQLDLAVASLQGRGSASQKRHAASVVSASARSARVKGGRKPGKGKR
jgi:hypothetical protein